MKLFHLHFYLRDFMTHGMRFSLKGFFYVTFIIMHIIKYMYETYEY